jgi:mono/diheme cytochrome c family protein
MPGTFPPLAGSEWVLGKPEIPIAIVLRGLQGPLKVGQSNYSSSMPPHKDLLKDEQIAEILTYVRSSWGNSAGAITSAQVARIRKRAGAGGPWSQAELDKFRP